MNRNELCFCGSGKKQKRCHAEIHPESAFANLIKTQLKIDEKIKKNPNLDKLTCCAGCYNCCYQNFTVSSTEFLFLIYNILKEDKEKAYQLLKKGDEYWEKYQEESPQSSKNLIKNIENSKTNQEEIENTMNNLIESYDMLSKENSFPCVFLDGATKKCSVYEYRPTVCRHHGVAYIEKHNEEYICFCDNTTNGVPVKDLEDLSSMLDDIIELSVFQSVELDTGGVEREYPMFYFCHIFYENFYDIDNKIHDYKDISKESLCQKRIRNMMSRTK